MRKRRAAPPPLAEQKRCTIIYFFFVAAFLDDPPPPAASSGRAFIAHHVIGGRLSRETRIKSRVDDVVSTGALCGGLYGEHRYAMWWMMWRAPVH